MNKIKAQKITFFVLMGFIFMIQFFINPITSFAVTLEDKKYVDGQMSANYNDGKYKGTLERYLAGGMIDTKYVTILAIAIGENRASLVCNDGGGWDVTSVSSTDYHSWGHPYSENGYVGHLDYLSHTMNAASRINAPSGKCTPGSTSFTYHKNDVRFGGNVTKDTRYYRYRGWVNAPVPDPTDSNEEPGTSTGKSAGDFTWKLNKASSTLKSRVKLINSAQITGDHYATRNKEYTISGTGVGTINSGSPITHYVSNPNAVKNNGINYKFSYEYTNDRIDHYTCAESRDDGCLRWRFSHSTPDWGKVQKRTWSDTITADHKYGEDQTFTTTSKQLVVGRTTKIETMARSVFHEKFNVDPLNTILPTQSWKEIDEDVTYSSDLGNRLYALEGDRFYYPNDIDVNLRNKYENGTSYNYSDYALPLRINQHTNNKINFTSHDNFFLTKNTGLVFSLPYNEVSTLVINQTAKGEYESVTGETYDDSVLTSTSQGSRYYLNTDMNGEQEPDINYDDNVVVGKLGLSDVNLLLMKKLQFEKYLFGVALDDAVVVQQKGNLVNGVNYANSIKLTPEQVRQLKNIENHRGNLLHSFRTSDNYDVYNQVKGIIPSLN